MTDKMKTNGAFKDHPYWDVIDKKHESSRIREMVNAGKKTLHDGRVNEMLAAIVRDEGGLRFTKYPQQRSNPDVPIIREMLNTSQGQMALLEKVRIDVAFGLADVPLLYGPIYQNISRHFPGGFYQIDEYTVQASVIFLEKFEGGEVEFGTLQKGAPSIGKLQTYAAGFEWTEDMIVWDDTYSIQENTQAFGRAYNMLLNHLHLSPIIGYSYGSDNITSFNSSGSSHIEDVHLTLQDAYRTTVVPNSGPRRTGTVLLASEADRFDIESAILTPVLDQTGNALPNIPIDTIIYYDGDSAQVGTVEYDFAGVTPGECFLVFPQRKMKELVEHDLRIDLGPADISRLVEGQQVGRTRRGVYANITESVQKVSLAAS